MVTSCVGRSCFLLIQVGSHFCRSRLFKVLRAAGVSITAALGTLPSINSSEPQQASLADALSNAPALDCATIYP